jgi:hypothetical protein
MAPLSKAEKNWETITNIVCIIAAIVGVIFTIKSF